MFYHVLSRPFSNQSPLYKQDMISSVMITVTYCVLCDIIQFYIFTILQDQRWMKLHKVNNNFFVYDFDDTVT